MKNIIPYSPKNGLPGCMLGKEMEISSVSQLKAVRFFLTDYGKPEAEFSCTICRFSDKGFPDTEVYSFPAISFASSGNEWVELTLESENIALESG